MSRKVVVLARNLVAMTLVVMFASDAGATAVLIVVSRNRVLLAADGMSIQTRTGLSPAPERHCKIDQVGDAFLIVVGVENYDDTGLNIPSLARKAFSGRGDLSIQVGRFEKAANGPIIETLRYIKKNDPRLYALLSSGSGPPISVFFAGKINGALGVVALEYVEAGGAFKEKQPTVTLGSADPVYQDVGDVGAIDEYLKNHQLGNLDDVTWLRTMLGVEIDSQPAVGLRKVGPPISILEITGDGARWIDQGTCANVRAQPRGQKPI
jgi:hypothetical protein